MNVNCERACDMMHDRLDGILSDADDTRLDAHLSSCPACDTAFAQLMDVDAGLCELRTATVLSEVSHRRHFPLRRVSRIAAGVVLAVGVGLAVRTAMVSRVDPTELHSAVHTAPRIELTAGSAERYLPIVERTDRPDVHIVWLHRMLPAGGKDGSAGDGASLQRPAGVTLEVGARETTPRV